MTDMNNSVAAIPYPTRTLFGNPDHRNHPDPYQDRSWDLCHDHHLLDPHLRVTQEKRGVY